MHTSNEKILILTGENLTIERLVAFTKNPNASVEVAQVAILCIINRYYD